METLTVSCGDQQILIQIKGNVRARRLSLRLTPHHQGFILTVPPRTSQSACQRFLTRCMPWIEKTLPKLSQRIEVGEGTRLCLYGEDFQCVRDPLRRKPTLCTETGTLRLPKIPYTRMTVQECLKQRARECLSPYVRDLAKKVGQSIEGVSFRDMRSRWGSCSRKKTISLNWRLILAPREVAEYVCAHEVAHLVHMNHSVAFWRVVEELCPSYKSHKKWLKAHGHSLMGV